MTKDSKWGKFFPNLEKPSDEKPQVESMQILETKPIPDGETLSPEEIEDIRSAIISIIQKAPLEALVKTDVSEEIDTNGQVSTIVIKIKTKIGKAYLEMRLKAVESLLTSLNSQGEDLSRLKAEIENQVSLLKGLISLENGATENVSAENLSTENAGIENP